MADGLRFTDLTQLASNNVNGQDITAISHYNAGSYSSVALQIQDLGRALLGNLSYTTELPNFGNQTIYGALLQLLANFANVYNPANTYAVNDCVIYQGVLYKCTTAISTPEAWDSTHWTAIKAVDVGQGGGGGGASSLGQLSDVTITSATLSNGQILNYDSSSHLWINVTPDLSLMSDVTISSVSLSNGQFFVYDSTSSKWVNKEVIHEPITQAQYDAMVQAGTVDPNVYYPITDASISATDVDYDSNTTVKQKIDNVAGAIPVNSDFSLSGLSDTTITSPSSGQVLSYDGGKWKNTSIPTTCTIAKGSTMPASFPIANLQRYGNICVFFFSSQLPARTYANSDVLWNITPVPKNATRSTFLLGNTPVTLAAYNSGEVRFNTSQTLASDTYLIGELVFYTED